MIIDTGNVLVYVYLCSSVTDPGARKVVFLTLILIIFSINGTVENWNKILYNILLSIILHIGRIFIGWDNQFSRFCERK